MAGAGLRRRHSRRSASPSSRSSSSASTALLIIGAAGGALGVALGIWLFGFFRRGEKPRTGRAPGPIGCRRSTTRSVHKWWFDDLNDLHLRALRRPGRRARCGGSTSASSTARSTASAALTQEAGRGIRHIQTGRVQNYALGIAAGLLVIAVTYLFVVSDRRLHDTCRCLSLVIFVPLVGALVLAFMPRDRHSVLIRWASRSAPRC